MVILGIRNKITDFLMILAWASPFKFSAAELVYVIIHIMGVLEFGGHTVRGSSQSVCLKPRKNTTQSAGVTLYV